MTRLEDELRAAFAERTAGLPVVDDAADRAIRRAVRTRRRQATLAGLAVVITISLVGIGVLHVPWTAGPATMMSDANASAMQVSTVLGIRLDLRVGNQLWTADGRRLPLPGAGAVTWVYRVPAGWVYGGTAGVLRMLLTDGAPAALDQPADTAVVSTDGQRIAWSTGSPGVQMLALGQLTGTGVDIVARTKVPDPAEPVAIVGSTVVVGLPTGTGKPAAYDVWNPPTVFLPSWQIKLAGVYGDDGDGGVLGLADDSAATASADLAGKTATADADKADAAAAAARTKAQAAGKDAVNASPTADTADANMAGEPVPDGPYAPAVPSRSPAPAGPCLVRYPLPQSGAQRKLPGSGDCGLGLAGGSGKGSASPDKRWLVATATSGLMFVSLAEVARPLVRICPLKSRAAPVWEDSGDVLVASGEGLVRCGLDGSRRVIQVEGLPASGWDVVPALGTQ